jgi:acyl-CoA synthetase (NDP forming)
LFAPRGIALVGASGDPTKNTARPQRYLRKHGYAGKVFPINPSRSEVLGEKAYRTLADCPETIDHALIMVEDVEQALEDCGRRGVPVASVYSNGFADAGEAGAQRQAKLAARARALGVRLLGPNSMGVIDVPGALALSVNAVLEMDALPRGATSIVSQSGTMLGTVLSRGAARGLGFAKLVSVGNEADLGVAELVELLAGDAGTRVILLFLETIRDAPALARAARSAHAAGKPLVAYKLGRSALGAALARSHTGALAGTDSALDAFFRDHGIVRVDLLETLIEIAPLLAGRKPPQLARPGRVAVVTTTGGGAAAVIDRLGSLGVELASMSDLTMAATQASYRETLEGLLASPQCDAVLACVGSSAQFHPQLAVEPIISTRSTAKPHVAFLTPHAERSLALLAEQGVPAFRTPEACADALAAYLAWRRPKDLSSEKFILKNRADPFELLAALGIPIVEQAIARAPDYAHALAYPVAIKKLGLAHKTESGGVILDVADQKAVARVAAGWGAREVLVQRMERGLAEAIVGYRDDPVVGPIVLLGAGGVLAEVYRDFAVRTAPVSRVEAEAMILEVKGLAPVRGYRNLPKGDLDALADAIVRMSRLTPPLMEAEINPLLIKADGVVAVDALVVYKDKE